MVIGHGANSSAGHWNSQQLHGSHSDSHDGGLTSLFFSCLSPFFQLDVKSCWSCSFDHKDNVLPASLSREVYNLMRRIFGRWEWKLDHPLGRNIPPAGNPNMHLQRLSFDQSLSLKIVSIFLRLEKRFMQNIATASSVLQCIIQKICISNAPLSIKVCFWQISQPQLLI